jgi:CBS-domain-containing membrane protein
LQLQESGTSNVFVVLDSAGSLAGMLTLDDMLKALARRSSPPS